MTQDLRETLEAAASGEGAGLRRGLWIGFLDPYGVEVAVGSGMDWLGVDLQHGNLEVRDLPGLLRVAEAADLPVLARVPSHDATVLGRVLDTGVDGVIVPLVESAEQAAAIVSACRTPPVGTRSTGGCRAGLGVTDAPRPPLVLTMVETAAGLEHASEIIGVAGVDGAFVGPYDLSISSGFASAEAPETVEALRRVVAASREAGKIAGFMAGLPGLLAIASEADLVAVDTDAAALRVGLARLFAGSTAPT